MIGHERNLREKAVAQRATASGNAAARRDEELIAALLYLHMEDYCESIASDQYKRAVKAAFCRIGVKYEPFGPDAMKAVEAHMKGGTE